jgi:hypothetical protein
MIYTIVGVLFIVLGLSQWSLTGKILHRGAKVTIWIVGVIPLLFLGTFLLLGGFGE